MLISIVGKSASGKSSIARYLASLDDRMLHVDIDQISHYVLTLPKVQEELKASFGPRVVEDGEVNRKALGKLVFASTEAMDELTRITWPSMEKILDGIIQANEEKIILLDWLLLPKTKFFEASDLKIWIDAPLEERTKRAIQRAEGKETITKEYFQKRDAAGLDYEEGKYDIFIANCDTKTTRKKVEKIYEKRIISR